MIKKIKQFLFTNKTTAQTIVKNTFWLASGTILSKLIRASLIIYAGRILGAAGYGIFSYALSLAAFFTVFSDMGISALSTRTLSQKPKNAGEYFYTSFILKLIAVSITIILTILLTPHLTKIQEINPLIPFIAILLAFDSLRNFAFSITRANNKMEMESLLTILTNIFITSFGLIILFLYPTPKNLAIGYSMASALGTIIVFIFVRKYLKDFKYKFNVKLIKPIIYSAVPFALAGIIGVFMINIDTIILGAFRTASELGFYGAAQRIVQFIYIIPAFLSASMFPIMSRMIKNGNFKKASSLFSSLFRMIMILAIPMALGGALLSREIITFLFGNSYAGASTALTILSLTIFIVAPSTLISNSLFALDKQKVFVISSSIGAVINVILDILLIPKYGIVGSASVTLLALSSVVLYNWSKLKKYISGIKINNLNIPIISSIVMTITILILKALHINVLIIILLSGLVYVALLLILKDKSIKEAMNVFKI